MEIVVLAITVGILVILAQAALIYVKWNEARRLKFQLTLAHREIHQLKVEAAESWAKIGVAKLDTAGRIPASPLPPANTEAPALSIAVDRYMWTIRWHGSPPMRGDTVYCKGSPVAYLGDQHHDTVGELVQAHNAVVEELVAQIAATKRDQK